jgi:hypothetical protein
MQPQQWMSSTATGADALGNEGVMEAIHFEKGEQNPVLGPAYFSARDAAEKFMAGFEAEQFKPLLEKFVKQMSDQFTEVMWEKFQEWLIDDTQRNIQGAMWRDVDAILIAMLGGEQWILRKYILGERYDCEKVRATLAALIPAEIQEKRIADLEKENKRLRESLEMSRRY